MHYLVLFSGESYTLSSSVVCRGNAFKSLLSCSVPPEKLKQKLFEITIEMARL